MYCEFLPYAIYNGEKCYITYADNFDLTSMQGVVRAGANDYRVTMYKTFTIPLNLLCTQFDSNPMLYLNALNNSQLQFTIDFQDATVAKIFGTAGPNAGAVAYNVVTPLIFDDSLTGIVDIGIKTINKNDKSYQDDLRD